MRIALAFVLAACGREGFVPGGPDAQFFDGRLSDATPLHDASIMLDAGLLLHYTFDDGNGITNDTGSVQQGASCSGTCPLQVVGRVGAGAVSFDGSNCLDIADQLALRPTEFSAALWLDVGPGNATGMLFDRPYNSGAGGSNTFALFYESGSGVVFGNVNNLGAEISIPAMWHHLAISFDGGAVTTYFDGIPMGTSSAGAAMYGNDPLHIGCGVTNGIPENNFFGYVDDVRLYDRVLSPAEMATLAAM